MSKGIFPDHLKIAKIVPIFKSGDASDFSNYRPISILPVFSKIYERIVYARLLNHLADNQFLHNLQFGFRSNHSTAHALIQLIDKISQAIDRKEFTVGVFIDLAKAFDTVNHSILLSKLEHYGVSGTPLSWFTSYLSSRKQYTIFNDFKSDFCNISHGVPQGSILGPLLFLIYINDLPNISTKLHSILLADDTNLFYSHPDINHIVDEVNIELVKLTDWLNSNRLSLNIKKSHFLVFSSSKKKSDLSCQIKLSQEDFERLPSTKFLGITLDENLTWKTHITNISLKIAKNIGIINKVKSIFSQKLLTTLYYNLIFPYLS